MIFYISDIEMQYVCPHCGYIYDEKRETRLFICCLSPHWKCPKCGTPKESFTRVRKENIELEQKEQREEQIRMEEVQKHIEKWPGQRWWAPTHEEETEELVNRIKRNNAARQQRREQERQEELARQCEEQKRIDKVMSRASIVGGLLLGRSIADALTGKKKKKRK